MKAIVKNKAVMFLAAASLGFGLTACGKDKTAEQYQRQQLQESLEVYQSIAGSYRGAVVSAESGRTMGALELVLRAETQPTNPNGGDISVGAPLLVTNVRFRDSKMIAFSISSSYYNEDTGAYSATVIFKSGIPGDQEEEQVLINGTIKDGVITGTIGAVNSAAGTGRFTLRLNGDSFDKIRKVDPKAPTDRAVLYKGFSGYGTKDGRKTRDGLTRNMRMTVEQLSTGNGIGDFINIFYPEARKRVDVTLDFSGSIAVTFQNAIFDPQNGTLQGDAALGAGPVSLQCQGFYFTEQDDDFGCYYRSVNGPFNFVFKP